MIVVFFQASLFVKHTTLNGFGLHSLIAVYINQKRLFHIKGYIRKLHRDGIKRTPVYATGPLKYTVNDPRNNKIAEGTVTLNEFGAFDYMIVLPDNINLGDATITYQAVDFAAGHYQSFTCQEFRRPEYTLSSSYQPQMTHITHPTESHAVTVSVNGRLFAGGALSNASVSWSVNAIEQHI